MAMAPPLILRASLAAVAVQALFLVVGSTAWADPPSAPSPSAQRVTIDFQDAAVPDVARFYADLMDRNFILGSDLEGIRITIIAPRPVTPQQAWDAFVSALAQRGLEVSPEGKFWRIARVRGELPLPKGATRYALRHARSTDVAEALRPLAGADATVVAWPATNAIIVVGPRPVARRLLKVARALDQPGAGRQIYVVPLEHADPVELADTLRSILRD